MRRLLLGISGVAVALLASGDHRPIRIARAADPSSLLPRLEREIAAREYEATPNGEGLQAPNRALNIRSYFDASGVRVVDRTAPDEPELVRLALSGFGREAGLATVSPGTVTHEGPRVDIRRAQLVEWYENKPEGLEQGFVLEQRPRGRGALTLELTVSGAELSPADGALLMRSRTGRMFRYGGLRAVDAAGHGLPARVELARADRVRLIVDDSNANYPVSIDPILTRTADTVLQANQDTAVLGAYLGFSVAAAGDTNGDGYGDLIVGAAEYDAGQLNGGAAFVFLGGPNGIASGGPNLAAAQLQSNQSFSIFGGSVASAGDVNGDGYADVIVGAYAYDSGETDEGAAFIFLGGPLGIQSGNPLSAATVLQGDQAHDTATQNGGYFAFVVASAGDVNGDGYADVLVGAPAYSDGTNVGDVFVFLGSPSGVPSGSPPTAATRLGLAAGVAANRTFGAIARSAGDVNGDGYDDVIVGASAYDFGSPPTGGAFIFLGSASGMPNATATTAQTQIRCTSGAGCGTSVDSAGDTNGDGYADVIIGAGAYGGTGKAFLFLGGPAAIPSGTELNASSTLSSSTTSGFGGNGHPLLLPPGGDVAGAGDVNGDGYSDVMVTGVESSGRYSAYLFFGSAAGVPSATESGGTATRLQGLASVSFGFSLAGAGDLNGDGYADVVLGDPGYDGPEPDEGAALVFLGGGYGIRILATGPAANVEIDSTQNGALFGTSVASAGDVNGDGYADLIVGAPSFDAGQTDEGAAFIFAGGPAGISGSFASAATTLQGDQNGSQFGRSVASAGDVNGDGYADVIVGAPAYDSGESDEGAAFVFLGGPSGVASASAASAHATLQSNQASSRFGWSVAAADVNGDGRSDALVGAPYYNAGVALEGAAFVFIADPSGIASGSPATASAVIHSNQTNAQLGTSVANAGDVNGDGYDDVIVGAPFFGVNGNTFGLAAIYRGSVSGISGGTLLAASTRIDCDRDNAEFGFSVAGAGDVNGDGYDDVIVGAPNEDNPFYFGSVFIFAGSPVLLPAMSTGSATTELDGETPDHPFGASVAGAGDLNGDGFADVVVGGAHPTDPPPPPSVDAGAWVFYGKATGIASGSAADAPVRIPDQMGGRFGSSVAGAGDVNGDGFADVAIGAPDQLVQRGTAFVFYGGGRTGRPVLARQLRGNGSGIPVQPLGDAFQGDGFVAQFNATHPAGRGRVKGQVQACPASLAFGAPQCVTATSPSWVAVTPAAPSSSFSFTLTGLPAATPIRWRARVLRADTTEAAPSSPAHGPWWRPYSEARRADIRTSLDADLDGVADAIDNCRFSANSGQQDGGGFGAASGADGIGDACQCGNVAGTGAVDATDVLAYRQSLANPTGAPLSAAAQSRCTVLGTGTACNVVQVSAIRRGIHAPALGPVTSAALAQVCAASHL